MGLCTQSAGEYDASSQGRGRRIRPKREELRENFKSRGIKPLPELSKEQLLRARTSYSHKVNVTPQRLGVKKQQ